MTTISKHKGTKKKANRPKHGSHHLSPTFPKEDLPLKSTSPPNRGKIREGREHGGSLVLLLP